MVFQGFDPEFDVDDASLGPAAVLRRRKRRSHSAACPVKKGDDEWDSDYDMDDERHELFVKGLLNHTAKMPGYHSKKNLDPNFGYGD